MDSRTVIVAVFTFATTLMSFSFDNAIAQNTTAEYPNDPESIQGFEDFEGNNTAILENATTITNPVNDLEDSLSINENESN